jgi:hypothetical protein
MKKSTKSPMKKPVLKKAQTGKSIKPTADSTDYFRKERDMEYRDADKAIARAKNKSSSIGAQFADYSYAESRISAARKADKSADRQFRKGKPGYDANGYPLNKFKPKSPSQQISEGMKTKKKNGGIIKAKNNKK